MDKGDECAYCTNEDCNVQPELKGYLDPVDAIAAWNTRARGALDNMPDIVGIPNSRAHQRSIINLLRWYDKHHETIRRALSAPVARVDVEKLRAGVGMQPTCTRSAMRNEGWNNCLDHISENYHLTPKTQSEE